MAMFLLFIFQHFLFLGSHQLQNRFNGINELMKKVQTGTIHVIETWDTEDESQTRCIREV
jgi:hypothetical protein